MSSADSQFAATQSAALRAGALREWLGGGGAGREEVQEELVGGGGGGRGSHSRNQYLIKGKYTYLIRAGAGLILTVPSGALR